MQSYKKNFLFVRTFKIQSLGNFQICTTMLLNIVTMPQYSIIKNGHCHTGGGVGHYGQMVSQPLLPTSVLFFSHLPNAQESVGQFLGLSQRKYPHIQLQIACLQEEVSSGFFCVSILNQKPPVVKKKKKFQFPKF